MTGIGALPAQQPPVASRVEVSELVDRAQRWLETEDPLRALAAYSRVRAVAPRDLAGLLGMAETYLFIDRPGLALHYVEELRRVDPDRHDAIGLHVRILIRAGHFERALAVSTDAVQQALRPGVDLLAAHASALFRAQRTVDAAEVYQRLLVRVPRHAEAHLRLGSGLLPPRHAPRVRAISDGILLQRAGELTAAAGKFAGALEDHPGHPVAHRLLGEVLYGERFARSVVQEAECFRRLEDSTPTPSLAGLPVDEFLPGLADLTGSRRKVAARTLKLFGSMLQRIVSLRGRHDLLREDERTTDAPGRENLRGKRTFDGRVWDDVRGVGGLRAATGIEALDEAARFEFNTLSHELAHQAHFYAFSLQQRRTVTKLFEAATRKGRCLDFYAATNEAEYFGQGVEAFVSLAKRPGCEKTHGHTRFELFRTDPDLYHFIANVVEFDPLERPADRAALLPAAVHAALLSGRPGDAVAAAGMMDAGLERDRLLARARRALTLSLTY